MDNKKILRIILIIFILILSILTIRSVARFMFLVLLITINVLIAYGKQLIKNAKISSISGYLYGIELIMFCTVITSIGYGARTGSIMGGLLMAINYIGESRFSRYFILTIPLYVVIGYYAYYFSQYGIIIVGIVATLIYNILINTLIHFFKGKFRKMLVFSLINILFNVFLFTRYAEFVLRIVP